MKLGNGFRAWGYYRNARLTNILVTIDRISDEGNRFENDVLSSINELFDKKDQLENIESNMVVEFLNWTTQNHMFVSFTDDTISVGTGMFGGQ